MLEWKALVPNCTHPCILHKPTLSISSYFSKPVNKTIYPICNKHGAEHTGMYSQLWENDSHLYKANGLMRGKNTFEGIAPSHSFCPLPLLSSLALGIKQDNMRNYSRSLGVLLVSLFFY
jgi:hypothetical protein